MRVLLSTGWWLLFDALLIAVSIVLALFLRRGDQLYFTTLPILFIGMRRGLYGNLIAVPIINFIFMMICTIQQRTFDNVIDVQLFMTALMLLVQPILFLTQLFV